MITPSENAHSTPIPEGARAKNCLEVGTVSEIIHNHVRKEFTPDLFPVILGGDHCISIGTISAIKAVRPKTAVVWVSILNHHLHKTSITFP